MTTAPLFDMVQMSVSGTPGTGTISLGGATAGYQSFASAGAANGDVVSYSIVDAGSAWEVGHATYNSAGPTLSNRTVTFSSNGNAAVSLTSGAIISNALLVEDIEINLRAKGVTANASLSSVLPAGAVILYAMFRETAGNAVSVAIGSTSGGADVMPAIPVPASGFVFANTDQFNIIWFSASVTQQLFLSSSNWNGASINVTLIYRIGP